MVVAAARGAGSVAQAQTATAGARQGLTATWSADVAIGWDNSISGNINSSGIGRLNDQAVVITKNSYESVYGTGLHFRFGGGYMLNEVVELRGTFSLQSLDADLTRMGDYGASNLYGQYEDYQSFGLDVGLRRYHRVSPKMRAYGEGTIGIAFIDETDVFLSAPAADFAGRANDFYDRTAAFAFGMNAGLLYQTHERVGLYGQVGLRWMTGMSPVDGLEGTGLETINDKSARTTFPFLLGVRFGF
jgi:hypothetical protein